jgi:hypothetical protein
MDGDDRQLFRVDLPGSGNYVAFCFLRQGPVINTANFGKWHLLILKPGAMIQTAERKGPPNQRRVDFTIEYCEFDYAQFPGLIP